MESAVKHTPGPWVFDSNVDVIYGTKPKELIGKCETDHGADWEGCSGNQLYDVCKVNHLHVYAYSKNWENFPAREDVIARALERYRANAALITAAPDLLEVLKSIENDDGHIPQAIWEMRNAAIDKAEGKDNQ